MHSLPHVSPKTTVKTVEKTEKLGAMGEVSRGCYTGWHTAQRRWTEPFLSKQPGKEAEG